MGSPRHVEARGCSASAAPPAPFTTSPSSADPDAASLWLDVTAGHIGAAAADTIALDYQPELPTASLIAEVRQLLSSERRAGGLASRYLADLADRIADRHDPRLRHYTDELQAAASLFALGPRETRERIRIGRALRQLPQLEAAFAAGTLAYSRVREITRVAPPDTESTWLDRAQTLDMRTLEHPVARAAAESTRAHEPPTPNATDVSNATHANAATRATATPDTHATPRPTRAAPEPRPTKPSPRDRPRRTRPRPAPAPSVSRARKRPAAHSR